MHGVLVQLPLPEFIEDGEIVNAIAPQKDVDGLHEANLAKLHLNSSAAHMLPCTPLGCYELIRSTGVPIAGSRSVVIGRSRLVGRPMAAMLTNLDSTVTLCHTLTPDLPEVVRQADILVVAAGERGLVRGDWLKPGVCVIDVGITPFSDEQGRPRVAGDVRFAEAWGLASHITPVPGGVGPMTVAMLLANTHAAWLN